MTRAGPVRAVEGFCATKMAAEENLDFLVALHDLQEPGSRELKKNGERTGEEVQRRVGAIVAQFVTADAPQQVSFSAAMTAWKGGGDVTVTST